MKKVEKETEPTAEELKKMRDEHMLMLDESIEVLEKEAKYNRLLTEIDGYRTKRLMYNIEYTQIQAKHSKPTANDDEKKSDMKVLKKEENGKV